MEKRNRGLSELLGRFNWEEEGLEAPPYCLVVHVGPLSTP